MTVLSITWPLWEPTSQGSPRLQTQLQDGSRLIFSVSFPYIAFSSFTFPGAPYRIFLPFPPWLPGNFYLVVIEQQQQLSTRVVCGFHVARFEVAISCRFSHIRQMKCDHMNRKLCIYIRALEKQRKPHNDFLFNFK